MNVKKLRLGLIGKDVSKSQSERIHRFILMELGVECEYERFSVPASDFDNVMRRLMGDFDGFNVTIPYKRDVMEYLDEIIAKGNEVRYFEYHIEGDPEWKCIDWFLQDFPTKD